MGKNLTAKDKARLNREAKHKQQQAATTDAVQTGANASATTTSAMATLSLQQPTTNPNSASIKKKSNRS